MPFCIHDLWIIQVVMICQRQTCWCFRVKNVNWDEFTMLKTLNQGIHVFQIMFISWSQHIAVELISKAKEGMQIAAISDAGMPLISDPGYRLLQACIDQEVPYTVLPGPSAVLTALAGSGMPCHSFSFDGFLPVKKGKRKKSLEAAAISQTTAIFFESPHRIVSTIEMLAEIGPNIRVCVARELSKKFETYHRGTALNLLNQFQARPPKGEIVLLIDGCSNVWHCSCSHHHRLHFLCLHYSTLFLALLVIHSTLVDIFV